MLDTRLLVIEDIIMVRVERDVCPGLLDLSHNIVFSEMTWVLNI